MHRLDRRAQGTTSTAVVREGTLSGRPGEVTARTVRCTACAAVRAA